MKCNNIYLLFLLCLICNSGCKEPTPPFIDEEPVGTDPYCLEIADWEEEVAVNVSFVADSKKNAIEVSLEPKKDVVDMSGRISVAGGTTELIATDKHGLWLVLKPAPESTEIVVSGALSCRPRTAAFTLAISLDIESRDIAYEIEFQEEGVDAGVGADGGDGGGESSSD